MATDTILLLPSKVALELLQVICHWKIFSFAWKDAFAFLHPKISAIENGNLGRRNLSVQV